MKQNKIACKSGTNQDDSLNKGEWYLLQIKLQSQEKGKLSEWHQHMKALDMRSEHNVFYIPWECLHPMREPCKRKPSSQSSTHCSWTRRPSSVPGWRGNTRSVCFQACWQACRRIWSWRWGEFAFVVLLKWSLHGDTIQVLTELVILCFQNIINSGQPFHFLKNVQAEEISLSLKSMDLYCIPVPRTHIKIKLSVPGT